MKHVYASGIDISNFRTFGPNFHLSIPPEPGLIIVYGMNGLGKTTFFEAIEWLLTGDVRRIRAAMPPRSHLDNHLTRHNAEPNSHFVAATFDPDDTRVSRSVSQQPSSEALHQLLVSPNWTPKPEDISTYLRLTVFLPQARKFRFEEENPKDQWQLLRGPAGVDQLDVMRRSLGGLPTKNAFDRVVAELRVKLSRQQREVDDWKDLLNRRTQLATRVTTTRTVTPEQAESFLSELRDRLMTSDVPAVLPEPEEIESWTPERKLSTVVQSLDTTSDEINSELERLRRFSGLIEEWITVGKALENDSARIAISTKQLEETEKRVAEAKRAADQCSEPLEAAERQLAEIQGQRATAEKASEALARLVQSRKTLVQMEQELATLKTSAETFRRGIADSERIDQERKTHAEALAGLVAEEDKLKALSRRVATFDAAVEESARTLAELKTLQDEQRDSIKQQEEIESKIEQCRSEAERLEQKKKEALADAKEMTRAIKIVCDHIAQDATKCPVCRTEYEAEELKERAEQSVAETGIDTEQLDQLIDSNRNTLEEHESQRKSLQKRISELPPAISELARHINVREQEASVIQSEFLALGYDPSTAREQLQAATEAAAKRIGETREKTAGLPSAEDSRKKLDKSKAALVEIEDKEKTTETAIGALQTKIEQDEAIVEAFREQSDEAEFDAEGIARILTELHSDETTLKGHVETAKRKQGNAQAEHAKLAGQLQQLKTTQETQNASLTANEQRQETLSGRWQQVLSGSPDVMSQQRAISERENAIEKMSTLRRECSQTAERLDAWRASNESTELASAISAKLVSHDNCTERELTAKLETDIAETQSEIDHVREAQERAINLAAELQEKVDEFNDRALKPLKKRIQRFHDVLSPFRYQIDWEARTHRGAVELRQSVTRESGSEGQRARPQVELSEGQMAVQGLSTLFAASTEYRWSRWPTLLLDDPLQSSDLLHTSAFIDILRGLIAELGYQVFLSSHDMEEAKYVVRKCERSGISVTKCHLLGPRSNGVRTATS